MVKITVYRDHSGRSAGFDCMGHAEYAKENDIVCAGISALVINCINSIEKLTDAEVSHSSRKDDGMISFRIHSVSDTECKSSAELLIDSLVLGLESVKENYGDHLNIAFEEV